MPSTDQFDLNAILANLYRVGPTEDERKRAASQAFARMGLGILAANQPSPTPRNPLGVLGQGGLAGMDAYQADLQRQMQERRQGATGALAGLQIQKQIRQQEALKGLLSASQPAPLGPQAMTMGAAEGDIGPTQTNLRRLDALEQNPVAQTYTPVPLDKLGAAAAGGVNIDPFLKLNEAARPDVLTIDLGDKIREIDKRTMRVLRETPKGSAPASTPFEAKDLAPGGYRDFLLQKGRAGATTVDVKVANKTGESLAKPIGEMVQETRNMALGGLDQIDAGNRITAALNSGKVITGPGAKARVFLAQIGEISGLGGKDNAETLQNTRQVIKGLAEFALSARKQLKGQGQVSDYEGKLIQKAASGDIEEMTEPEIRTVVEVSDRLARKGHELHQTNIDRLKGNENYKDLADFYAVPPLPPSGPGPKAGNRIRYDARGNRIP